MKISERIRKRLNECNMSVKELSRRSGVPATTLYSMLNRGAEKMDIRSVIAIAHALDTTADELLGVSPAAVRVGMYNELINEHASEHDSLTPQEQAQARRLWAYYCRLSEGERSAVNKIMGVPEGGLSNSNKS